MYKPEESAFAELMLMVALHLLAWVAYRWLTLGDRENLPVVRYCLLLVLHSLAIVLYVLISSNAAGRLLALQVALLAVFHIFAWVAFLWMTDAVLDDAETPKS